MPVKQHDDAGPAGDCAADRVGLPEALRTPMRRVGDGTHSAPNTARNTAPATSRISSERLFAGATELQIEHRGSLYRLKQTSLGKLILTK